MEKTVTTKKKLCTYHEKRDTIIDKKDKNFPFIDLKSSEKLCKAVLDD